MRVPAAVIAAVFCIAHAAATATTSSPNAPPTAQQQPHAAPSKPDTSGSILTALSVALLVHNLMPVRLSAAWGAASTAAAWAYLLLVRLQPWLLLQQLRSPLCGTTAAQTLASAAQAEAVVAAAGLSPAAAAGAAPGAAHHWWQQGLFSVELLLSMALDAVLLLGLLLLPVMAFQRWWAGRRIGSAIPATVRGAGGDEEALQPSPTPLEAAAALGQASRDALQGAAGSSSASGTSALASARSERRSTDSTRSLQKDSPDLRQPATPPLCFEAALGQGPPGSAHHVAHSSCTAAAHPRLPEATSTGLTAPGPNATPRPSIDAPPTKAQPSPAKSPTQRSRNDSGGSDTSIAAAAAAAAVAGAGRVSRTGAGDSSQHSITGTKSSGGRQQQPTGSSTHAMASLNLGSVNAGGHSTVRPPACPSRALYNSPLETVVISCKLSARTTNSTSSSHIADAAGLSPAGTEQHALPLTSSLALPSPGTEPPRHTISQRQLRAVVEAAVRQAVASANIGVLSTTVTSFPGCVHAVAAVSLQALAAGSNAATGQLAGSVEWEQVVQHILAAQQQDNSPAGGALAAAGLQLKHMLVQDTAGNVHCLWVGLPDEPDASSSASSSSPGQPPASGLLIPSLARADAGSSSSGGSRGSTHKRLMHAASATTLSSFALSTDASNAATDAELAGGSSTSSGPVLQLPPALTGVLAEVGAGLRIVITGTGSSSSGAHLIADHTLWPGTSLPGNEVPLSHLLPAGVSAASLAEDHGPVLSVNLVASPPTTASAAAASTTSASAAAAADSVAPTHADGIPDVDRGAPAGVPQHAPLGECLLLQLPVLLLPSATCAAELQQLSERMVQELGGNAAAAAHEHMLPLVRDLAAALVTQSPAAGERQRLLLQQLVAYLHGQGLRALTAAVCSMLRTNGIATEIEEAAEPAGAAGAEGSSSSSGAHPTASAAEFDVSSGVASSAATGSAAAQTPSSAASNQAAKVMQQANAAHQQALAAQRAAAAMGEALQLAQRQMTHLMAAAAAAGRQATAAEATAAGAHRAAAAVEQQAERQRALQLIGAPAGHAPSARGVGILGLLSGGASSLASGLLGGGGGHGEPAAASVSSAAEPPRLPARITARHVLLGFEDERSETQYRRLKALASRSVDTAALALQAVRQAVYVWRIAHLMFASAGTGLSLVLLCKYEAVVLLPYLVSSGWGPRLGVTQRRSESVKAHRPPTPPAPPHR
jgi:hypothetical protein